MRFAPHKLGKVGGLMAKYAGDEEKLLRIVRRKYVSTGEEAPLPPDVEWRRCRSKLKYA